MANYWTFRDFFCCTFHHFKGIIIFLKARKSKEQKIFFSCFHIKIYLFYFQHFFCVSWNIANIMVDFSHIFYFFSSRIRCWIFEKLVLSGQRTPLWSRQRPGYSSSTVREKVNKNPTTSSTVPLRNNKMFTIYLGILAFLCKFIFIYRHNFYTVFNIITSLKKVENKY